MSLLKDERVLQVLVTWAVEKTLLDLGRSTYDKVVDILKSEYQCSLADCFEHPEYLKRTIRKLSNNSHVAIVVSITNELKEFLYKDPIRKFVDGIIQ